VPIAGRILKRLLVGRPLGSDRLEHTLLPKRIALPVFASDALSSVGYAPDEIFLTLSVAGLGAYAFSWKIGLAVALVMLVVVASYRQNVHAYPSGGGDYEVATTNLGPAAGLTVASALLVDYVLTVAVSISSAAQYGAAAIPALRGHEATVAVLAVALLAAVNLRGVRESGTAFAIPTYVFMVSIIGMGLWGLGRMVFGDLPDVESARFTVQTQPAYEGGLATLAGALLLLRSFSSGCAALTGVEAISNGVPAFRRPESKNAATTLMWMAVILGGFFFGISVLAHRLAPTVQHEGGETVLSILGRAVFHNSPMYFVLQVSTAAILTLAANTAFADFPRLSSIIARDGFLPRQLFNRGDRLVFSNGVIVLAVLASVLLIVVNGEVTHLIPLYAVGVFTGFTLSQFGMVRHHQKERQPGWRSSMVVNAIGAVATGVVLVVVGVSKFTKGAWLPIVVIPLLVMMLKGIKRHYDMVRATLAVPDDWRPPRLNHTVVVLVGGVHRGVLEAMAYARSLAPNHLVAVTVVSDEEEQERIQAAWEAHGLDTPLDIVYSPYRELSRPILKFIDEIDARWDNDIVTVLIPEFVVRRWWEHILHNQTALFLKGRLLFREGVVVTSVPYHVRTGKVARPEGPGEPNGGIQTPSGEADSRV
jgi:amino acid transporter